MPGFRRHDGPKFVRAVSLELLPTLLTAIPRWITQPLRAADAVRGGDGSLCAARV